MTKDGPSWPTLVSLAENRQAFAESREKFIPLRRGDLLRVLLERIEDEDERARFARLARALETALHLECRARLLRLLEEFAPFDPDRDTADLRPPSDVQAAGGSLVGQFAELLQRANYRELERGEIDWAVAATSDWGVNLHVNFDLFDFLHVYSRGNAHSRRVRRRWRNLYRQEEVDVPIFRRLVLIFCLTAAAAEARGEAPHRIHVKMFKNIPRMDVDMLLPGAQVRMTIADQLRILVPTLSGLLVTLIKLLKGVLAVAFAGVYGALAFVGLVGGTIGYGIRSFFGYQRTKDRYRLNLTESLYYQNLDNNAGVLYRVVQDAEEQEFREAVLAYFLLWREAGSGWTAGELDGRAEELLQPLVKLPVDFEVHDALGKLARLGLADSTGVIWRARPLDEGHRNLLRVMQPLLDAP